MNLSQETVRSRSYLRKGSKSNILAVRAESVRKLGALEVFAFPPSSLKVRQPQLEAEVACNLVLDLENGICRLPALYSCNMDLCAVMFCTCLRARLMSFADVQRF